MAAAFIGPGTVTICTLAGVSFGPSLLWALLLSAFATIVLQEMSARLGIITQKGLAQVIRENISAPWKMKTVVVLILLAILIGNAAYEAGNIGGGTLGLEAIFGRDHMQLYPWIIGVVAFLLLYYGSYKMLEKVFVVLVLLMSVSFLLTAIITKPDFIAILRGLFVPSIPEQSIYTIIGLVGTTVVPYNLFLHASLVKEKWSSTDDLPVARRDTLIAIALGGIISMAVLITATAIPGKNISGALDLAKGLEPLYGDAARYAIGVGLFAAGITSAITAPLAAAYVANSCFAWNASTKDLRFRLVWGIILLIGVLTLSFDFTPIEIIKFAQIANGLLLPLVASILLWMVNKSSILGSYVNSSIQNFFAIIIILMVCGLGIRSILNALGWL